MKQLAYYLVVCAMVLGQFLYSMDGSQPEKTRQFYQDARTHKASWFYNKENPYTLANQLVQQNRWWDAELKYTELLEKKVGDDYDKNMAKINYAVCKFAQRKASNHWVAFDEECGIKKERKIKNPITLQKGTCIVETYKIGIGDIVHFFKAVDKLKKSAKELEVKVALRKHLHAVLEGPAKEYKVTLVDEDDLDSIEGKETHLIALLGHLYISPHELEPEKPMYTTSDTAFSAVRNMLDALKKRAKKISPLVVFLGENRQTPLIGGKELPHDIKEHGRHVNAREIEPLLRKYPSIFLIDCNPAESHIKFTTKEISSLAMSPEFENRVVQLPPDVSFNTHIALSIYANAGKELMGMGVDNGSTAVFTRALSKEAQERFAVIIPNGKEYDMRMEGDGEKLAGGVGQKYKQMFSSYMVYRCKEPENQSEVIMQAYKDMAKK